MIPSSHLSLPFLAGHDLPQFPFQKVTAMQPISFYQPLFAQPDVTHAIVDALRQWPIYGALFGAGLDAWRRLNAKKLADEATPSSRQS